MTLLQRIVAMSTLMIGFGVPSVSHAQVVLWNESSNGNLSADQDFPSAFTLSNGVNSLIGSVQGGGDFQDWVAVTIPTGFQLTAYTNSVYVSADPVSFTGFQAGPTFVGSPFSASSHLGYMHFGTNVANGTYPLMNVVGINLLPIMADPNAAPFAQGFTVPLGPGDYTFLIMQLGALTNYQFDFTVVAVPEPSSLLLGGLAAAVGMARWRKPRHTVADLKHV